MTVKEKYLISWLKLLDLDSLIMPPFGSCIAWHCGKPSPSIPQIQQSEFSFMFWPP
jgi:hypothetical protein